LDFEDHIRPLSKTYLAACLDTIALKSNKLTVTEKKELAFYQQEFKAVTDKNIKLNPTFFAKDKVASGVAKLIMKPFSLLLISLL
jgi:hypothetical protein